MTAFILRRLAQSAGVILAMIVIVFFGVNVVGDPTYILVSPDMTTRSTRPAAALASTGRFTSSSGFS
jgi:ABC-type dipeptide/oligopeptide/nickel transport system permease component